MRNLKHLARIALQDATQLRRAAADGVDKRPEIALGRRPGVVPNLGSELPEGPSHGVGPACIIGMGRQEDVADERPIGLGSDRTRRGGPRSEGGPGQPRWEHGGRLPQQRRPLVGNDRGTPAWRWGGARAPGGG